MRKATRSDKEKVLKIITESFICPDEVIAYAMILQTSIIAFLVSCLFFAFVDIKEQPIANIFLIAPIIGSIYFTIKYNLLKL